MNILITNDDGILAPGLNALAKSLMQVADVTIIAPDRNRSGASNSLTLDRPLRLRTFENGSMSVDGTPTDCIHLALTGLLDKKPDLVVSGINAGANLGDDVFYSGTVAGAMEGRLLGVPAIAFSLAGNKCEHYTTAAEIAKQIVMQNLARLLTEKTILNVNIPDLPLQEIKGFQMTRLGFRHFAEPLTRDKDPRGEPIYWIGPPGPEQDAGTGTDFYAINNRYVSMTPMQLDLTHHVMLEKLQQAAQELVI